MKTHTKRERNKPICIITNQMRQCELNSNAMLYSHCLVHLFVEPGNDSIYYFSKVS